MSVSLRLHDHLFALYKQIIRELSVAIEIIERLERPNKEDIKLKNFLDQELEFNKFHYLERFGVFTRLLDG